MSAPGNSLSPNPANLYILLKTYKNGDRLDLNVSAYANGMVK